MTAIKKYVVQINFLEKKPDSRKIAVFAMEGTAHDDICNLAEAQMLDGLTDNYRNIVEISNTKVLSGATA